ncbi:MAG: ATP-binding cassette domain-containing protein [Sulfolobales archaeon]
MGDLSTKLPPRYIDEGTSEIVLESLRAMDIEGLADRYLNNLSDGELRREIIGSIIARRPKLLVLDEPLASLNFNAKC